jgi:predicted ribosomally synthesized peptide with nif11-like leader
MLTNLVGGAKLEGYTPLRAMSADQLTAFWEAVEADASLQEKLSASTDGEIDTSIEAAAVVAIAKDAGFTITAGDLLRADAQAILELNDDELQEVAGGLWGIPGTRGQTLGSVWRNGRMGLEPGGLWKGRGGSWAGNRSGFLG